MNGKWDHSTKPSTYKLLDNNGEIIYNGSFSDCMKHQNKIIMDEQDAGFSDAENNLQIKLDKIIVKQKEILKEHDRKEESQVLEVLQDVRKQLFGSYHK